MAIPRISILSSLKYILTNELDLAVDGKSLGEDVELLGKGIGLDSVEILKLVAAVEERFDLTLDDDELEPESFRTLGSLATLIERQFRQ